MVQMLQHIVPDDLFEHFACVEEIKSDHKGKSHGSYCQLIGLFM